MGRAAALGVAWRWPSHREGARLFLAGRTRKTLKRLRRRSPLRLGCADVAVVDALDERAVDEYVGAVASQAGSVDISFNLISRGDVQGIPLVDMSAADLMQAVAAG